MSGGRGPGGIVDIFGGANKPTIRSLMKYRDDIAPHWHDLGTELLQEYAHKLNVIQANHPNNVQKCCGEMFQCWLELDDEANWNKLIGAVRRIDPFIANRIAEENLNVPPFGVLPCQLPLLGPYNSLPAAVYQPQHAGGYQPQNAGGYQPQHARGYQPQNAGGYQPQHARGYQPQNAGGYQPKHAGGYQPQHVEGFEMHPAAVHQLQHAGGYKSHPAATTSCASTQCDILSQKPEMFDITKIVIPKIMNEWEDIADALRYDLATIKAIKNKEREDPKKCCRELFRDWLMTNNGAKAGPKVWSTLLDALKELDNISADITEDITAEVKQLAS